MSCETNNEQNGGKEGFKNKRETEIAPENLNKAGIKLQLHVKQANTEKGLELCEKWLVFPQVYVSFLPNQGIARFKIIVAHNINYAKHC